jgi:plastocyanin
MPILRMTIFRAVFGLALAVPMLRASLPATVSAADGNDVAIQNFAFGPPSITVAAGTTVTWTNKDDEAHQVMSKTKLFHSSALDTKDAYSFTFKDPGTYEYFCTLHPQMTGTIVVK